MTPDTDNPVTKRSRGRPTIYSDAIVEQICLLLAHGRSLKSIAAQDDMPCERTLFNWLDTNDEFRERYDRARQLQAEIRADSILELVDNCPVDKDEIQLARLKVDAIKWVASRLLPHRYGDRLAAVSTADLPTLHININVANNND